MKRPIILLAISSWTMSLWASQPNNTAISATVLPTVSTNIATTSMLAETTPAQLATDGQTLTQAFQLQTNGSNVPLTLSSQAYSADNKPIRSKNQVTLIPCQGTGKTTLSAQAQEVSSTRYSSQGCGNKTAQLSVHIPPQQVAPITVDQQNMMVMIGSQ